MEPILAGSIYAGSSIKLLHLVPFGQQTRPLGQAVSEEKIFITLANQKKRNIFYAYDILLNSQFSIYLFSGA
jgi:hypothetical protein